MISTHVNAAVLATAAGESEPVSLVEHSAPFLMSAHCLFYQSQANLKFPWTDSSWQMS